MLPLFSFQKKVLNIQKLSSFLHNIDCGGFVCFEGRVRNRNQGKDVAYLEYEGYEPLAIKEFEKIKNEAKEKYDLKNLHCVHRIGQLKLGDVAVWLGVAAVHRKEAFLACEYIISELKQRLPIWKKEIYTDKNFIWINEYKKGDSEHKIQEKSFYYFYS